MNATDSFLKALHKITGTGQFHSTGTSPFFLPGIHLEGVGELAFPLPTAQAEALKTHAEPAPYGQGTATILDETVRKCWQLDAAHLSFQSPEWPEFLELIATQIREDLGIKGRISLHPYKLLLYGPGGHFRAHRDTEKLDSMIGSLIVALPSAHDGGELLIRHDDREVLVDFSDDTRLRTFQYAAFFADCEHEVRPVRSGYRCCLAYDLRLDHGNPSQLNVPLTRQSQTLTAPVTALRDERSGQLSVVPLEHQYTRANLSWAALKGNDAVKGHALSAALRSADCHVHLALLTLHQMGQLEDG